MRGLRPDLSRSGDADRAVVVHEVGGPGHEQAGRAEKRQRRGDDGEVDTIHARQQKAPRIVPIGAWVASARGDYCRSGSSLPVKSSGESVCLPRRNERRAVKFVVYALIQGKGPEGGSSGG
jgi:hypothetical protein